MKLVTAYRAMQQYPAGWRYDGSREYHDPSQIPTNTLFELREDCVAFTYQYLQSTRTSAIFAAPDEEVVAVDDGGLVYELHKMPTLLIRWPQHESSTPEDEVTL